jgi:glycosyltransferase involved in cell wall biosynthesis
MHETAELFYNVELPASGSEFPADRHLVRGWLVPKPSRHFVDVRAVLRGRLYPAVHGLPRPDLAEVFKLTGTGLLAGFELAIDFEPGANELVLEALAIDGQWSTFAQVVYRATPRTLPPFLPQPLPPLRWHEFCRVLGMLFRAQRREPNVPLPEHARKLLRALPLPHELRLPPLPFHGHLDDPAAIGSCVFGRTHTVGYLFHETLPIKRVLATYDLQAWQTLEHTKTSEAAKARFPQLANATRCGIAGPVDVPAQIPAPAALRFYAELEDGSLQLCFVQRSWLYTHEDEKAPYPPKNLVSFAAMRDALTAALAELGMSVIKDGDYHGGLGRLEQEHRLRAPEAVPPAAPINPAPSSSAAPLPRRVLLVSHNLNIEGAPLFLFDYAAHLASAGVQLTVLSAAEGELRPRFEQLGAKVEIIDVSAVFAAQSKENARAAIATVRQGFPFQDFELVVANTFTTFWAVHAAKAAGCRVLFYVHESTTPANFYLGGPHADVILLANEAFGVADAVSFTSEFTRNHHLDYGRPDRHWLTPGWINLRQIDAWLAAHSRETLRANFKLRPDELMVANVGTVCGRKGQHIFARAVDLLWRRYPELAARTRFVILGGLNTLSDVWLQDLLLHLARPNLEVHPTTADHLGYYAAADLFVCSTYEESSPRVVLEAMACRAPILSSDISAVREQVRPELEAVLVPPGDSFQLCEAMVRVLQAPELRRELATKARQRLETVFDPALVLPRHAALASELAARVG